MSLEEEFEDKVDELVDELASLIGEYTDETVVDEEYMMNSIRSLAEDAVSQYYGIPDTEEGENGIIEYYGNMDGFEDTSYEDDED